MRTNLVIVENGKFIFDTNFAGDPKKDRFGSDERKANLVIPDIDLARELIDDGFNVRLTKPRGFCAEIFCEGEAELQEYMASKGIFSY